MCDILKKSENERTVDSIQMKFYQTFVCFLWYELVENVDNEKWLIRKLTFVMCGSSYVWWIKVM
jgi:hypothetical protein